MIEVNGSSCGLKLSNHQMNLRLVCLFSIIDLSAPLHWFPRGSPLRLYGLDSSFLRCLTSIAWESVYRNTALPPPFTWENFVKLEFIFDVLVFPSGAPGPLHLSGQRSLPLDRN